MADATSRVQTCVCAGPTNVTITTQNGQKTLPMLQHGDKLYVVAAPNEEFQINVTRHDPRNPRPPLNIRVRVDGKGIGYRRMLWEERDVVEIKGYMGAPGAAPGELTRFKFQPVPPANQATAAVVNNPDEIKSGRIQVTILAVGDTIEPPPPSSSPLSSPDVRLRTPVQPVLLPEGVKFYMAPSLGCGAGANCGRMQYCNTHYASLDDLGSVELHYETVDYLLLRKVLDPTCAAHKAIIEQVGVQAAADPATPGAGGSSASASKRHKRAKTNGDNPSEPVRKRSRTKKQQQASRQVEVKLEAAAGADANGHAPDADLGGGTGNRPAAAVEPALVIDLTDDAPLVVHGQELRKDQLAVCDLVGDGTEQQQEGAWRVMDKVKEEVVLD